jgi:Zn-dependent protease with chaperone function
METIDRLVLTFLANALWQVPAVVACAALAAGALRRAPARFRHALWLAALGLAVALPVASLLRGGSGEAELGSAREEQGERIQEREDGGGRAVSPGDWSEAAGGGPETLMRRAVAAIAAARPSLPLPPFARALTVVYLIFMLAHAVGVARAWSRARSLRLQATAPELPPALAALVADCCRALGLESEAASSGGGRGGEVEILSSPAGLGPFTLGAFQPAVLLPPGFLAAATPEEGRAILGHELAHVRRCDYATNLLGEALLLPIAFHPAARLLRRRIAAAREIACDELAVERLVAPRAYARALLAAATHLAGLPRPAHTLGVFDADILEERMRRWTDRVSLLTPRRARTALVMALFALLIAGLGASALAVDVAAAETAALTEVAPFAGTWIGYLPGDVGKREPAVELTVRPEGAVALTLVRLQKAADGSITGTPIELPVLEVDAGVAGGSAGHRLTFRTRVEDFRFRDWPAGPAETTWTVELQPDGRAVLTSGDNSYFAAAKARGEAVPPPPPPTVLERHEE